MEGISVARFVGADNSIPKPPSAAYQVLQNGKPLYTLTADELDKIVALHYTIEAVKRLL
jgi:hypothetical protein